MAKLTDYIRVKSASSQFPEEPTPLVTMVPDIVGYKIKNNGSRLASRDYLNFIGENITINDDGVNINITFDDVLVSGADNDIADYKLQRPYFQDWAEVVNARGSISGAQTIDMELGNVVTATITGATQFTFSNPPATGRAGGFVLVLTNGGAGTITWPTGCKGLPTTPLTASGIDQFAFLTVDGGTTYNCTYRLDVK